MPDPSPRGAREARLFFLLLAATTLLRVLAAGAVGYTTDEAHYVLYGRHLAWGYVDHSPLVGLLARAGSLLGGGPLHARLPAILCWPLAFLLLRRLCRELFGRTDYAFFALVASLFVPLAHVLAVSLLPDAPLNVLWVATLLFVWRGLGASPPDSTGAWSSWAAAGLCLGGALLAKYHAVLLVACVGLHLVLCREHRGWLRRPQPWGALALGLAVFVPNVVWNARHDWVSYAFQLGRGAAGVDLGDLGKNLGGQLAGLSPGVFALLCFAWWRLARPGGRGGGRRGRSAAETFVLVTSAPVFLFFLAVGLTGELLVHWAGVGLWTGSLAAAHVVTRLLERTADVARVRRRLAAAAALGGALVLLGYAGIAWPLVEPLHRWARGVGRGVHARFPGVPEPAPFEPGFDPTNELFGWDEIAAAVLAERARMPDPEHTFVFTHRFFTASSLAVHLPPELPVTTLSKRMDQYHLWFDAGAHVGWDAIFVDEDRFRRGPGRYAELFRATEPAAAFSVRARGTLARSVELHRFQGFRGARQGESP